jgi:hypothetical protein
MGRACSTNREKMNAYGMLLRRPRCRWLYNIKTDLREIGWGGMNWIDLAQDRDRRRPLVNKVMNLRVS